MKIIEEKHNHINKVVYRTICPNCGSTLEYDNNDIINDLYHKPLFVLCPVCRTVIPHKSEEWSKFDTTAQPTPEEHDWLPPLNLEELLLSGGINTQQKFMLRDGQIATFVGCDHPNGSLELTMMVNRRFDRYNGNGVRLTYRDGHWCEDNDREADVIFMI